MNLPRRPTGKMPELKAPQLKVPDAVKDVYLDMRERRLLPLVALVVVAIAAMPFLLGGEDAPEQPLAALGSGAEAGGGEVPALTVVRAAPGLRDWRQRLDGRTPTDPFKQRHTKLPAGAKLQVSESGESASSGASDSIAVDGGETAPVQDVPEGGSRSGGSPGGSDGGDDGELQLFGYRPDVRFGVAGSGELKLHKRMSLGAVLPKKQPLLIFMGISENGQRAAFNLDAERVEMVRGDGKCIGGRSSCRVLFLREGEAVDLITDRPGRVYRLKLSRIELVEITVSRDDSSDRSEQAEGSSGDGAAEQSGMAAFAHSFSK